jgi:cytochrome P450
VKYLGTIGIFTGEKWRAHRKLFTPTFHFKILEEFVEVINSNEKIMIQKLEKHMSGPEFDICPYVTLCALDIICGKPYCLL